MEDLKRILEGLEMVMTSGPSTDMLCDCKRALRMYIEKNKNEEEENNEG